MSDGELGFLFSEKNYKIHINRNLLMVYHKPCILIHYFIRVYFVIEPVLWWFLRVSV